MKRFKEWIKEDFSYSIDVREGIHATPSDAAIMYESYLRMEKLKFERERKSLLNECDIIADDIELIQLSISFCSEDIVRNYINRHYDGIADKLFSFEIFLDELPQPQQNKIRSELENIIASIE